MWGQLRVRYPPQKLGLCDSQAPPTGRTGRGEDIGGGCVTQHGGAPNLMDHYTFCNQAARGFVQTVPKDGGKFSLLFILFFKVIALY